jgi:hypothetical protein
MDHVGGVEQLCDRGVDVCLCIIHSFGPIGSLRIVLVIKDQIFTTVWTVVIQPVAHALPVLMRKDLQHVNEMFDSQKQALTLLP